MEDVSPGVFLFRQMKAKLANSMRKQQLLFNFIKSNEYTINNCQIKQGRGQRRGTGTFGQQKKKSDCLCKSV